jgi:hypothetical protein
VLQVAHVRIQPDLITINDADIFSSRLDETKNNISKTYLPDEANAVNLLPDNIIL